jgi:hypothetical protein
MDHTNEPDERPAPDGNRAAPGSAPPGDWSRPSGPFGDGGGALVDPFGTPPGDDGAASSGPPPAGGFGTGWGPGSDSSSPGTLPPPPGSALPSPDTLPPTPGTLSPAQDVGGGSGPYAAPTAPGGYGYGYGAPGAASTGWGYPPVATETDKGARTSLILGVVGLAICGVILGPAAIIEGVKARKRIRESGGALTGDSMAIAGIVLGIVAVALFVVIVALSLASSPSSTRVR